MDMGWYSFNVPSATSLSRYKEAKIFPIAIA